MDTLLQVAASWILPALFFWFLFSVMAMIGIEFVQRTRKSRQNGLEEVIRELLGETHGARFYQHALVNPLEDEGEEEKGKGEEKKKGKKIDKRPSYISPSLFAKVVMDWMLADTQVDLPAKKEVTDPSAPSFLAVLDWLFEKIRGRNTGTKPSLHAIIQKNIRALEQENKQLGVVLRTIVTQADLKTDQDAELLGFIQKDLEAWFLEAVGHMTSVYGARLQGTTILVSFLFAAVANFDLINITVRLWETAKYSELKALGQTVSIDPQLFIRLPVGWYLDYLPSTPTEWIIKITGIGLGAFFIAVGSQYVFNLTKKQYKPATEKDSG
jgi:hypothetical protein